MNQLLDSRRSPTNNPTMRPKTMLLKGLGFTILYTVGSIVFGLLIGLLVGLMRLSKSWLVNAPLIAYIEAFRCTPLLVQIIWFYYAFPVLVGIDIPAARRGLAGAVALHRRVLRRDLPRRRDLDRARPMGRRPGDRHAAHPGAAAR